MKKRIPERPHGSQLFNAANLSAGEDFERPDLFKDANRRRAGGGEVDQVRFS
ncbi:MAG: hypothetical protein PVH21_14860 [Myxococcales bacterium]